jgi:hypothetical protein
MSRARKTAARIAAADPTRDAADIPARLEYLRGELRAERISYGELAELQSLSAHIDPADVELLEAAGVPEHEAARGTAARIAAEPADLARDAEYAKQQQEAKAAQNADGEPSMKTFTIEVSGATLSDVEMAIDEVKRVISAGNTSGFNDNETGSFSFDSSGEYADRGDEGTCPSCDADLPAGAVKCPECGSAVDNPESEEWGGRECYACNTRLYGDEMTCPDCGAEQKPLPGSP